MNPPKRPTLIRVAKRSALAVLLVGAMAASGAWLMHASLEPGAIAGADHDAVQRRLSLSEVKSWVRAENGELSDVSRSAYDLAAIDPAMLGGLHRPDVAQRLETLQRKPDGSARLVLARLAIGEADDRQPYWRPEWSGAHGPSDGPSWLGARQAGRRGTFNIRYWDPGWEAVLIGSVDAMLDRILAAGFDGVYLTRAGVFARDRAERPSADADMVALIERLSAYARHQNPGFIVVLENAEELLASQTLRQSIDAVAKEHLFYGINGPGIANDHADVASSVHFLQQALSAGRRVLVTEHLEDAAAAERARALAVGKGFIPYISPNARSSF